MRAKAVIRLKIPMGNQLEAVFKALKPEVDNPATTRLKANVQGEDSLLILRIEARDTVALRAALNSYLRWISAVYDCLSVLKRL
jgi:tRNA threonylcarbamoyladenosine modification (KEOPS) complex  Pcc1 subunit